MMKSLMMKDGGGMEERPSRRRYRFTATTLVLACILGTGLWRVPAAPCAVAESGVLTQTEIWSLYRDAENAARQANDSVRADPAKAAELYRKAVIAFERIRRDGGIENGRLYYNIGNIYFRLGDLGRAVLNYRRAERLTPHDPNLQQNLEYSRSRCVDKIQVKPEETVLRVLFFWHYDMGFSTRGILFILFFDLIWILGAVQLFRKRSWLRYGMTACTALSLMLAGSIGVEAYQYSHRRPGVVIEKEVVARKGDSTTFEPTFKDPLHAGTEFTLVEERRGWYDVELGDGRQCWIPISSAELL